MATRGYIEVVGTTKEGNWIVKPDGLAVSILADARRSGIEVEIRQTVPSRGTKRARLKRGLRLVGD